MKFSIKINQHLLLLIICAAVLARVGAALFLGNQVVDEPGTFDQISYHNLALRVLDGKGFSFGQEWWPITAANAPTAHWSFLYTLFLVVIYKIFGVLPIMARLIQAIIVGILQPYLIYLIGMRLFKRPIALVAAALTALYAYFVYYGGALMTESFFITAILASFYFSFRIIDVGRKQISSRINGEILKLSILLGLMLGIVVLLRQLYLFIIPFQFLWIFWARYKNQAIRSLSQFIPCIAVVVLMILPFTYYNYVRFNRFVLLNTNSGYAFFWANNPVYGTHFQAILPTSMGTYQDLIPQNLRNLDEAALDQALFRAGIQFVIDDPVRYVLLSASRIPVYFMFWPSSGSGLISNVSRVISFGLLWPFMLYGLIRSIVDRRIKLLNYVASPAFFLMIFVFIFTMIHLLSWSLIRYRLPVDAVLMLFAGSGLVDLAQRIIAWRGRSAQLALSHKMNP